MRRAAVVTVLTGVLLAGGAGTGTASSGQRLTGAPVLVDRAPDSPEPLVTPLERPRPGSIPHLIPRGPRPVPMPELRRSGPRPVPMPRLLEPTDGLVLP